MTSGTLPQRTPPEAELLPGYGTRERHVAPSLLVVAEHSGPIRISRAIYMARAKQTRYEHTPRGAYVRHRQNARTRGISFELTFDQWWKIWEESGLWKCRGTYAGGAVMMRNGDTGPYAVGNVRIGSHVENVVERNRLVVIHKRHTARSTTVLFE